MIASGEYGQPIFQLKLEGKREIEMFQEIIARFGRVIVGSETRQLLIDIDNKVCEFLGGIK
jgi:hypothetical protein